MVNPCNHRAVRQFSLAAVLALSAILLAAGPALAQIWISPDRRVVILGRPRPVPVGGTWVVTPVVVGDNRFVRVGGTYSGTIINPTRGYPGTGFIKPFYPSDRARASNFSGVGGPIITGPWLRWW